MTFAAVAAQGGISRIDGADSRRRLDGSSALGSISYNMTCASTLAWHSAICATFDFPGVSASMFVETSITKVIGEGAEDP